MHGRRRSTDFAVLMGAVVFMALPVLAFGQPANDYHLFGTVKDAKGNPIPGARIVLREKGGWKEHVITTDKNGKYDRWFIPHGVYEVRIEKPGYKTLTFEWDLSGLSGRAHPGRAPLCPHLGGGDPSAGAGQAGPEGCRRGRAGLQSGRL
jgi:hypothetical protein